VKWFLQYFLAPLSAAALALLGNYYLYQKPEINKEYTKMGVDIVLQEKSPMYMRKYAHKLIEANSPIKIPESEKQEKLEKLLKNIPVNLRHIETLTNKELLAEHLVLIRWSVQVRSLCPECVNKDIFQKDYEEALAEINALEKI